MTQRTLRQAPAGVCCLLAGLALAAAPAYGQPPAAGDWPTYGADLASTRYAPLDQIDAGNFDRLEVAWHFKTDNLGPRPEPYYQATPLVVDGMLYATGGTRRAVFALDAATGELKWVFSLDEGARGDAAPRRLSGRCLAYWADGADERIVYVTPGYQMVALDAKTGRPLPGFGRDGMVDLRRDNDQEIDPVAADIGLQAAPLIASDVIVIGAAHAGNNPIAGIVPPSARNAKGYVRGYDVRTGRRLWIFHTVPTADEYGRDSWLNDSSSYTGNTGAWSQMSADEELGLVYVPTETPTNDFYGGHRPGDNLFANSLVALDIRTGERRWHFQFTHHELWDYDLPCAPILADVTVGGRRIAAVAQPTKQGWMFLFDRATGEPIWPIEERPVPRGDVPGEWYSPTQPFPTRPPAYERQGIGIDDLIDFTPALRAEAVALVSHYRLGPIYTPPVVSRWEGPRATLVVPVAAGQLTVQGLPLLKPPWGRITAIDLNAGEIAWQVPHGATPDHVRDHPQLQGMTIPRTGRPGSVGTLVTATLVVAGEPGVFTTPSGRRGAMLRAYNKATGAEVGAVYLPAPQTGSPMTYMLDGRQFLVVAVSGGGHFGELIAFTLPSRE